MTLSGSEQNMMASALVIAADRYIAFALDAAAIPGGERLRDRYLQLAEGARYMAIVAQDSMSVEIATDADSSARLDAAKITAQQFRDAKAERLAVAR